MRAFFLVFFMAFHFLQTSYSQESCEQLLQAELNLEKAAESLSARLSSLSSEEIIALDLQANRILAAAEKQPFNQTVHSPNFTRGLAVWTLSLFVTTPMYFYANDLRDEGRLLLITNHFSNFATGIGLIGMFDHFICQARQICQSVVRAARHRLNNTLTQKLFERIDRMTPQFISEDESARKTSFYITALMFTYFNVGIELSGLHPSLEFFGTGFPVDWGDFISGQSALLVYYIYLKTLDQKLQ